MKHKIILLMSFVISSCGEKNFFNDGIIEYKAGRYGTAIELFSKEIKSNPSNRDAYYERGNSKFAIGDYSGALADLNTAIGLNPHPAYYSNRSAVKSKLNDFKGAVEDASSAIALNSHYVEAYLNRGGAYAGLRKNKEALYDYSAALNIDSSNIVALLNRGMVYVNLNDTVNACSDWRKGAEFGDMKSTSLFADYCR